MRSAQILAITLAFSACHALEHPRLHHRDVTPTRQSTDSNIPDTSAGTTPFSPTSDAAPSPTDATTSDFEEPDACYGTATVTDAVVPVTVTVTVVETFVVASTDPLPEPEFITPPPPCDTLTTPMIDNPGEGTSRSGGRSTSRMGPSQAVPTTTVTVTKKTPIREVPTPDSPPSFNDEPTPPPIITPPADPTEDAPPQPTTGPIVDSSPGARRPKTLGIVQPPPPNVPIEEIISDILENIRTYPPDSNPSSPLPPQLPPSTITSPPDAASTLYVGSVPIVIVSQTIIVIGSHSLTITRNPTPNTTPPFNILGPTTTLTVDGTVITVAPPVVIGSGTTLIINPALITSPFRPSPTSDDSDTSFDSAGPSPTGTEAAESATSSAAASSHKPIPLISPHLTSVGVTATMVLLGVSWILLLVG